MQTLQIKESGLRELYDMRGFPVSGKTPMCKWTDRGAWLRVEDVLGFNDRVGVCPGQQMRGPYVVIDLDQKNGKDGYALFIDSFEGIQDTLWVKTPHGYHVWFAVDGEHKIEQATSKSLAGVDDSGIDIRYDKGYVVFGEGYSVLHNNKINMAPIEVLNWLYESNYKRKEPTPLEMTRFSDVKECPRGTGGYVDLSPLPIGQRNDRLFRWGCGLARGVHTGKFFESDVYDLIHLRGKISGLSKWECQLVFEQVYQYMWK